VTLRTPEARAYLERLRDLLPAREAPRVVREVEALVLDRAEAEMAGGVALDESERRALLHLGSPEALADSLVEAPLQIGVATRKAFGRWFAVLVAVHLLLALLLTIAKSEAAAIPGLLAPLPRHPWWATVSAVVGIVLTDLGLLLALFALLGGLRGRSRLPALALAAAPWTKGVAVRGLVLIALLAVLAHPLRDTVFAVRRGGQLVPFLAPDLLALWPWVDAVLGLCALRCLLVLLGPGAGSESQQKAALVVDVLASLAGITLLILASTRSEVVRLPEDVLGAEPAHVLGDLITRAFLVVFVGAALLLTIRVVKRILRLRQLVASA
jgi:hypothetical protein